MTNLQGAHEMEISLKWKHFEKEMILMAVRENSQSDDGIQNVSECGSDIGWN